MSDVPRFSDGRPVPDSEGIETQIHFANDDGEALVELPNGVLVLLEGKRSSGW